jgi:hypothetical protein
MALYAETQILAPYCGNSLKFAQNAQFAAKFGLIRVAMAHNDSLDDNLDILGAVFNNRSKNAGACALFVPVYQLMIPAVKSYNRGGAGGWRGGRVAQPAVVAAGRQPLISQYCTKNDGARAQHPNTRYSPYFAQ